MPLPVNTIINGKLLEVRVLAVDDVSALESIRRNPQLIGMQYPPTTDFAEMTTKLVELKKESPDQSFFKNAITLDGTLIGDINGQFNFSSNLLTVSWNLCPLHWGNGYMAKALTLRFQELYEQDAKWRLLAECFPTNTRCIRLMSKLGFETVPISWLEQLFIKAFRRDQLNRFHLNKGLFESRPIGKKTDEPDEVSAGEEQK